MQCIVKQASEGFRPKKLGKRSAEVADVNTVHCAQIACDGVAHSELW